MWNKEPELYRDRYYARTGTGKNTKRQSLRTNRLDVAKRRLADLLREDKSEPTLIRDIYAQYQKDKENKYKRLEYIWRVLEPFWGDLRPDQVTREKCREYIKMRNVANGTLIRELGALRSALYYFDKQTPAVFFFPKSPPPKDRYLTREEAKRLIQAADQFHIRLFIVLAITTAARKSALLELKWEQVDFERGLINLGSGDGNKRRSIVPMNTSAEAALEDAYKVRLTDSVIEYKGKPIKDVKNGFAKAVKRAGLKNVSPHVLRHTAAVWMAEDRVPMSEIAQFLGHTDIKITMNTYARYSPDYLRSPSRSLELGFNRTQENTLL